MLSICIMAENGKLQIPDFPRFIAPLQTKLYPSTSRIESLRREKLSEILIKSQNGAQCAYIVSAPPGYGKTTLIADWLDRSSLDYSWLTLDGNDNDPTVLATYLTAALERTGITGNNTRALFGTPHLFTPELLAYAIIEDIASYAKHLYFVFDDYHTITNPLVHEFLQFLLNTLPPNLSLILITREDPPMSYARLKSQNRVIVFRAQNLRFSRMEMKQYFRTRLEIEIDDQSLGILDEQIEGWAAGLQLIAVSMGNLDGVDIKSVIHDFDSSNRYVIDYFAEEILNNCDEATKDFLLVTSLFDRYCADLCDYILSRQNSQITLEEMEQQNYFVIPLDDKKKWYRYHPLFGSFLRSRIEPTRTKQIHLKASMWLESNRLFGEAISHVMLAGSEEATSDLVGKGTIWALSEGRYIQPLDWFEGMLEKAEQLDANLQVLYAWSLFLSDKKEKASHMLADLSNAPSQDFNEQSPARLLCLKVWLSCSEGKGIDSCESEQAFRILGESDTLFGLFSCMAHAFDLHRNGAFSKATELLLNLHDRCVRLGNLPLSICAACNAALAMIDCGKLSKAKNLCLQNLDFANQSADSSPYAGVIAIPLALAYFCEGNFGRSKELAIEAISQYQQLDVNYLLLDCPERILALDELAANNEENIHLILHDYRIRAEKPIPKICDQRMAALGIEAAVRSKNYPLAERLILDQKFNKLGDMDTWNVFQGIAYARYLLSSDNKESADRFLDVVESKTGLWEGTSWRLSFLVIRADVAWSMSEKNRAINYLTEAIDLSDNGRYKSPFLVEARYAISMLDELKGVYPSFVGEIRRASDTATDQENPEKQTMAIGLEMLSKRECEVLECIASGDSNSEIADKLFISTGTVKWHVNNIFSKTSAKNRLQAVNRAKELGLIG